MIELGAGRASDVPPRISCVEDGHGEMVTGSVITHPRKRTNLRADTFGNAGFVRRNSTAHALHRFWSEGLAEQKLHGTRGRAGRQAGSVVMDDVDGLPVALRPGYGTVIKAQSVGFMASVPLGRKSPSLSYDRVPTRFVSVTPLNVKSFVDCAVEGMKSYTSTVPSDAFAAPP